MSSLLMVNPHKRKKQSYLLNPANPYETVKVGAHKFTAKYSAKTGRFMKKRKNPMKKLAKKLARKHAAKKHVKRVVRKHVAKKAAIKKISRKVVRHVKRRRSARKAIKTLLAKPLVSSVKLFGPSGSIVKTVKIKKGGSTMARKRKSHKSRKHSNPFSLKKLSKGFINTNLLMDGTMVAGGMLVSNIAVNFIGSKMAFFATPMGKIAARLGLGLGVLAVGKKYAKYTEPLALGFIAPAALDVIGMVAPAGLIPAGGVKLLEAGYLPDVPTGTVSLEQGYMPDVQETSFGFSDN